MAGSISELSSSIETWAFRPLLDNSWMSEAFSRDTEALTKALQKSISDTTPSQHHQQQTQSVSSSGGSEPETVSKRVSRNAIPAAVPKITKRKSRPSKRSPTTYINADPSNFRQMVQQVTGSGFSSAPIGSLLKPDPHRPVGVMNRFQTGCILPTLDTSAFLLEHHHQKVTAPPSAAVVGQSSLGSVVAEGGRAGFDFDGLSSCFPTLDSWKVM